ncbi:aminoglycoside phosphotransferase family protein [Kitasatospora aureofaciens]|uniref:aminoglycoside phosphotransferase family protein n=1 Tax=Kitasatospora aureofaciens TaxID=1894 RepID=UPI001C43737C|nr:aminoglycoside phosphotransferase family protein [Kitasatospora aureofaciens]MBV6702158.1 aminoglycoside phosphotransferase family protein [Kitasatospora aureofaciens]
MSGASAQITVPTWLTRSVGASEGAAAQQWLADLPTQVAGYLERWNLTLERVLDPGGSLSLIAYVHRDDLSPAVLKAGLVTPETAAEHAALSHWAGRGAVLLLDAVPAEGVLLLERLHGDIPLRSLAEAKAMLEATSLLHRLWGALPEGHPFPTLADRITETSDHLRERRTLPGAKEAGPLVTEALETAEGLAASASETYLLHGDFHHGNVLAADRAPWLAIDPRPLAGERAFDLARLVLDRADTLVGSPGVPAAVRRRIQQLSDALEVDRDRLRGWTLFRAVDLALRALAAGRREDAELYLEFAGAV